jgi:hypothetical protein
MYHLNNPMLFSGLETFYVFMSTEPSIAVVDQCKIQLRLAAKDAALLKTRGRPNRVASHDSLELQSIKKLISIFKCIVQLQPPYILISVRHRIVQQQITGWYYIVY